MNPQPNRDDWQNTPMPPVQDLITFAFDRLLEQSEQQSDPAEREGPRICGLWLARRRMLRGLSYPMLAQRTGIDERTLFLIECGLATQARVADESMLRLCLVLEQAENDLEIVASVLQVALGQAQPEALWLESVAAEARLEASDLASAPAAAPAPVVVSERLTPELVDVLRVLRQEGRTPRTLYQIKKRLEADKPGLFLNIAILGQDLGWMSEQQLLSRVDGRPVSYRITDNGDRAYMLDLQRKNQLAATNEAKRLSDQRNQEWEHFNAGLAPRPSAG